MTGRVHGLRALLILMIVSVGELRRAGSSVAGAPYLATFSADRATFLTLQPRLHHGLSVIGVIWVAGKSPGEIVAWNPNIRYRGSLPHDARGT